MVPWRWVGQEGRGGLNRCSATELEKRLEDQTCRNRVRGEGMQLAYLFPWQEWPAASQGMVLELGPGVMQ